MHKNKINPRRKYSGKKVLSHYFNQSISYQRIKHEIRKIIYEKPWNIENLEWMRTYWFFLTGITKYFKICHFPTG